MEQQDDNSREGGLFRTLLNQIDQPREFRASYQATRDGQPVSPLSILDALGINAEILSPTAQETLAALEAQSLQDESTQTAWIDFRWKLTAFLHIQDIFDSPLYEGVDLGSLFHQYYFYFESRNILTESVLCGLNGFSIASLGLLRPFLEFSVLQNYYYRKINEERSYAALEKYFKSGINPSWHILLKKALPNDELSTTIKYRVQSHLSGLSESVLHPYHPDHSTIHHKSMKHAHSFESVYFWASTRVVIESALWVYYVNFPLLFCPVNLLRKFGYKLLMGVLIDEYGAGCIRRSMLDEDFRMFADYAVRQQNAGSVLDWYKDRPDLSDDEIRDTWNKDDGEYPGLWPGFCQIMARIRAMRQGMALRDRSNKYDDIPMEFIDALTSLKGWQKIRKRRTE